MGLFLQLQRLSRSEYFPLENFHTEIVAQVLRNIPALTLAWLRSLGATDLEKPKLIQISTQETYAKLSAHNHECDSRPDMVIRLEVDGKTDLIFVESKIPSQQGYNQLQRYADHLEAARQNPEVRRASLVFITRDFEALPTRLAQDPRCKLTRWFYFFQQLKPYAKQDSLAKELSIFMQENRMAMGNKISSTEVIALENFIRTKLLLDEALGGEVYQAAERILGKVSYKGMDDLHDDPRYVVQHGAWHQDVIFLLGYWFPKDDPDISLWIGLTIYSNPSASTRAGVREKFRGWAGEGADGWISSPQVESQWATLYKGRSLQTFLGEADHIRAIKNFFLSLLEEAGAFQAAIQALTPTAPAESPEVL